MCIYYSFIQCKLAYICIYAYIHSLYFLIYIFFAKLATIQYKMVTANIINICCPAIGTSPIAFPKGVNGTKIPNIINKLDDIYTALFALLSINGVFAVLIICIPIKLETILYVNHIVWKWETSLTINTNHNDINTIKSKSELTGPINSINLFKLFISNFFGFSKSSLSTLSNGIVICPKSYNNPSTNSCIGVSGKKGKQALAIITDTTSPKLKLVAIFIYFIKFTNVRLPFCYAI